MLRLSWLLGVCALVGLWAGAAVAEAAEPAGRVLRAGAAAVEITPPLGEMVVGGFAPFPATGVHDKLHARCLVLDNGEQRIGFVICDSLGIPRDIWDAARALIAKETEIPPAQILMAATHTHSATRASSDTYRPQLVRGIADAVKAAVANLEPAKIGWGSIDEPSQVFNRRWYVTDPELLKNPFGEVDKVRMNPPQGHASLVKPAGPVDPEVSFVSVQSLDGRPLALLANYSLHYVGGVKGGEISADYFGIFAGKIGERLGAKDGAKPFVGLLSNGTSGDVNNINFRQPGRRYEPYEKMAEVAELIAKRVHEAHARVEYQTWVPLGAAQRDLKLTYRKPDEAMQKHFAAIFAQPEGTPPKFHRYERNYGERVQRLLDGPDDVQVPLQVVRIGDLAIAAIPFEVFTEIGLEIKDKSPFAEAFTIEIANDYLGYLPTPAQHELGGYETWMGTNKVQLDASERITKTILELMSELKAGPGK